MTGKRRHRVAPPPGADQWDVRFCNNDAGKGWEELCRQAPGNTRWAWEQMCANPAPQQPTTRHHVEQRTVWVELASTKHPKATE